MNYLIDANNLAGKLDLLDYDDFDKKLIGIIQDWLGDKQKIVVLVFDSLDPLGDSFSLGNLEVIYSPRDNYNKSADDKILEIFWQWSNINQKDAKQTDYSLNIIKKLSKDDLVFVSDDLDLRNKVSELKERLQEKVMLMYNDDFIRMINRKNKIKDIADDERNLREDEVEKINVELLEIWK